MIRSSAPFVCLVTLGCVVPNPAPVRSDELRESVLAEHRALTQLLAQRQELAIPAAEPAGTIELNARLATLNDRLGDLLAVLQPASAPALNPAAPMAEGQTRGSGAVEIALLQRALDVVELQRRLCLENIANVNTPGWKRRTASVTTMLDAGTGLQLPTTASTHAVFTTGALELTDRALDVAIDGDGFFAVLMPDGATAYTRDGSFQINADGKIVTSVGWSLWPEITVPNDTLELAIDPEGRVTCRTAGSPDTTTALGHLTLHRFLNPSGMLPAGNNLLRPTDASGSPVTQTPGQIGLGTLKQGFVERSNVTVQNELVNLQLLERQRGTLRRVLASQGVFVR